MVAFQAQLFGKYIHKNGSEVANIVSLSALFSLSIFQPYFDKHRPNKTIPIKSKHILINIFFAASGRNPYKNEGFNLLTKWFETE
jgi:hypothetical protein